MSTSMCRCLSLLPALIDCPLARPVSFSQEGKYCMCHTAALKSLGFNSEVPLWVSRADGQQMLLTNHTVLAAYGG